MKKVAISEALSIANFDADKPDTIKYERFLITYKTKRIALRLVRFVNVSNGTTTNTQTQANLRAIVKSKRILGNLVFVHFGSERSSLVAFNVKGTPL